MENSPYKTPNSELGESGVFKRSVWWKIYFFFTTALSAFGMVSFFLMPGAGIAEVLSLIAWLFATVGLFGFTFLKRIYKPGIWFPFLVFYILFGIMYYFITSIDLKMGMSDTGFYINIFIGYFLSLPGYYALYAYGKSDRQPWVNA